ncbi:hypothetical protein L6452_04360 [Arctium lappa]|uniref:Uncharacterized protein n=1 Tax=Arctium lappa TaxID=4217 RepID=A0ACB9FRE6_ARCLA|nr:hypothetical protein L6452_04360 [Arctium lappa]
MEIKCFLVPTPTLLPRQSQFWESRTNSSRRNNKNGGLKVTAKSNIHEDGDHHHSFFQSALSRASFRFHESLRPEPLFIDPYAGCFEPPNLELDESTKQKLHHYCIGTRFIDDQLLSVTKGVDGAKQVVLFTDGMDTRAYRLNWPSSTVIYDVSPQAVFKKASEKLQDVGAKIPRSCLLVHVPLESSDMQQVLRDNGFDGCRPSIWVFQGFPVANLASFKDVLLMVGSLGMKGCLLLGELPIEVGMKPPVEKWVDEFFMGYGFRVRIIGYDNVATNLGQQHVVQEDPNYLLFVAEHLRFSDDQMENWRREFQRVQEDGDEEGFEEL